MKILQRTKKGEEGGAKKPKQNKPHNNKKGGGKEEEIKKERTKTFIWKQREGTQYVISGKTEAEMKKNAVATIKS